MALRAPRPPSKPGLPRGAPAFVAGRTPRCPPVRPRPPPAEHADRGLGPRAHLSKPWAQWEVAAPIKGPVFPAEEEPHSNAELATVCRGSRRRGTHVSSRPTAG
jgi:hypothetical protein